ncbi:MAG: glycine cleavage system aminomethyltransferase GcvT [Melioribacteraceae bacterium]|nr:glycine cleavage system aminomethyltransferase GcvT [Melioribacteraceae bacterium]MCF8263968.1 glycine cleavage system aminomethyltransferase GcvT [Melioribacteraceae bacterium]MCF8431811.1 glycine cleavage system aminomethyltransferase GcvT [Melioribacteraceae bacterium]
MKRTKFYDIHKNLGAKLVDFAGFEMPVQYSSIIAEHKAVRNSVGVFDVSHMGEFFVSGPEAEKLIQHVTVNNVANLNDGKVQYSAMCYEDGGIVDDLLVYQISDQKFMLVVNASNIEKDLAWINSNNRFDAKIENESDDYSLLAVQGPNSNMVINKFLGKEIDIEYYTFLTEDYEDLEMIVSRTGYTGELGFELYFKGNVEQAAKIWNAIFKAGEEFEIRPVGLAARDSLRLEKGFCLYGNDIDKTTNTIEAGLGWITKLKKEDFIGKEVLVSTKSIGPERKLVAMVAEEKAFPRQGYEIAVNGEIVGKITSGTVSPILEKPIALGYVNTECANLDSEMNWIIRNKEIKVKIVKLPFVG